MSTSVQNSLSFHEGTQRVREKQVKQVQLSNRNIINVNNNRTALLTVRSKCLHCFLCSAKVVTFTFTKLPLAYSLFCAYQLVPSPKFLSHLFSPQTTRDTTTVKISVTKSAIRLIINCFLFTKVLIPFPLVYHLLRGNISLTITIKFSSANWFTIVKLPSSN